MIQNIYLLADLLERNYGMKNPQICQLSSGATQTTMLVIDGSNKLVLKAFHDSHAATLVAEFQDYLRNAGLGVPIIVKTTNEKLFLVNNTISIVLMEYVDGHGIGWADETEKLDHMLVSSITSMLAKMHLAALAFKNDDRFLELIKGLRPMPLEVSVEGVNIAELRTALIHGDLTRENIIVSSSYDSVTSFIDFGDTMYSYLAYDLAVLLTQVFVTKTWGMDIQGIKRFMEAYSKQNPLSPGEQKSLIAFMLLKNNSLIDEVNQSDDIVRGADNAQSIKRSAQAKITLIQENEVHLKNIFENL